MADIQINDLHKYYGENYILKGINFEILKGDDIFNLVSALCGGEKAD